MVAEETVPEGIAPVVEDCPEALLRRDFAVNVRDRPLTLNIQPKYTRPAPDCEPPLVGLQAKSPCQIQTERGKNRIFKKNSGATS